MKFYYLQEFIVCLHQHIPPPISIKILPAKYFIPKITHTIHTLIQGEQTITETKAFTI